MRGRAKAPLTHGKSRDQVRGEIDAQIISELLPYRLVVDSVTDFHIDLCPVCDGNIS